MTNTAHTAECIHILHGLIGYRPKAKEQKMIASALAANPSPKQAAIEVFNLLLQSA